MKHTPLYHRHVDLGAKMVEFGGWEMPVHYGSIVQEHKTVRARAGVFDVSHMGRITVKGPEAEALLDFLSTNIIQGKKAGMATYTVWCREDGGAIDDLIVYKVDDGHFYLVVNASNREKDLQHLLRHAADYDVEVHDHYEEGGILAVQGPAAAELLVPLFPQLKEMPPMRLCQASWKGDDFFLSTTGYTGSGGCEVCASHEAIAALWDRLIEMGIPPIGLGARDTLRLEMGFALYGHELTEQIAPTESVSRWVVKLKKDRFLGKEALLDKEPARRYPLALLLQDKGIAREGAEVYVGEERLGTVTSGSFGPSVEQAVALALASQAVPIGNQVQVDVRGRRLNAEVVKLPFYHQE